MISSHEVALKKIAWNLEKIDKYLLDCFERVYLVKVCQR